MILLKGADNVVRRILPVALEAAGLPEAGEQLRRLPELIDAAAVRHAVETLKTVRSDDPAVTKIVDEVCFWCSAACEAAMNNQAAAFKICVAAAVRELESGLPELRIH